MAGVELVVKVGGSLLKSPADLDRVLSAFGSASRDRRLLIVPGGGPFADAVRAADERLHLSDDAAHWMAILAMDQYAHVLAERMNGSMLVDDLKAVDAALAAGRIPVLAPYRWLRDADPLPHSWDVTSDSIAAWIAGAVGARELLLIKPPGTVGSAVDAYFGRTLPEDVIARTVPADQIDALIR
jgi:5-(aminomethyl)-3-furanmethanol phosphate kinase